MEAFAGTSKVTDGGQLIRCPVEGISFMGRSTRGVTLFKPSKGEEVISVSRLRDVDNGDNGNNGDELDCVSDEGPDDGPGEGNPESTAMTETEVEAEVTLAQDGGEIETEEKAGEEPVGEEPK